MLIKNILINKARCRLCSTTLDATEVKLPHYLTCSCGSLAISGGVTNLKRLVRNWSVLEELSEFEEIHVEQSS